MSRGEQRGGGAPSARPRVAVAAALLAGAVLAASAPAAAEQAGSDVLERQHGFLDAGHGHTCAVLTLAGGAVRCWGGRKGARSRERRVFGRPAG